MQELVVDQVVEGVVELQEHWDYFHLAPAESPEEEAFYRLHFPCSKRTCQMILLRSCRSRWGKV